MIVTLFPALAAAATAKAAVAPRLAVLDAIILDAIHDHQTPGAVLLVGHNGHVIYRKAFGNRALEPRREPMTADTIFDLASLTKVIATTTAVMQLVQKGEVRLNDPVAKYIPEFAQNGKDDITVRNLLDSLLRPARQTSIWILPGKAVMPDSVWPTPKRRLTRPAPGSATVTPISLPWARWSNA